jgi:hypothetical protein
MDGMAKLRHLQHMIQRIAQVDEARARVLVMKARAFGHFATGGRGNNAPDMGAKDATSALLLSLHMDMVTDAGEAVQALRDLPLFIVKHDPGDGTFHDLDQDFTGPDGNGLSHYMPTALQGKVPSTLGDALDVLFARSDAFENRFDRIAFEKTPYGPEVRMKLADHDYQHHNAWDEGPRAWEFVFQPETNSQGDDLGAWMTKTVHGEALRALRDLIAGEGQD